MIYAVQRPEPIRKALDPSARVAAPTTDNQLLLLEVSSAIIRSGEIDSISNRDRSRGIIERC
jgi:hypothetical protein